MSNIIAISGGHSQGKTTLIDALENALPHCVFYKSFVRELQSLGFSINQNGDIHTQMHVLWGHYQRILRGQKEKAPWCFVDRCALDAMSYGLTLNLPGSSLNAVSYSFYQALMPYYTAVFYLEPELKIQSDGIRDERESYLKDVTQAFDTLIEELSIPVFRIKGSVSQRVEQILTFLETFQKNQLNLNHE